MTDHDEKANRTPVSELVDLPPKDVKATEADQVVGGTAMQASHEMKKALIGNIPR